MRFAIVGCGEIAVKHIRVIELLGGEIVAYCDSDSKKALTMALKTEARVCTSFQDLLKNSKDIDVISICSPNNCHFSQAWAALDKKKKVILEKPVTIRVADALTLAEHERANDVAICYQRRWSHQAEEIKEYAGKVRPRRVDARVFVRRDVPYWTTWRSDKAISGGGNLINIDIHYLDLLQWWLGKRYRVDFAKLAFLNEIDQVVYADLDFDGVPVTFHGSAIHSKRDIDIRVEFEDGTVMVYDFDDGTHYNVYDQFLNHNNFISVEEATTSLKIVEDIYREAEDYTRSIEQGIKRTP